MTETFASSASSAFPASRRLLTLLAAAGAGLLLACAVSKDEDKAAATVLNLDSLNLVVERRDSVESNHFFYEQAFEEYRAKYPGVDKAAYLRIAKGKDRDFCLFKDNPALTCLDNGDKFNDLNLKEPARDAYHAGLLSEGYNESRHNVRLWASMGRLSLESKDYAEGRAYLQKVLEVEPRNKWAKKLLASIPKDGN
ncbi:MAG TPA: hypothetical protein VJ385_20375 [Fibrobacteria bacterium]|nr:hypothetical protein [Fibrobacteria bacterium]